MSTTTTTPAAAMITIVDDELPYDTHNTYTVTFDSTPISTLLTNTPSFVDSWIFETLTLNHHNLIVGLDVEWRPNQSRNSDNPVATLQLCINNRCLIFQILHSPFVPETLKNFLRNPSVTFCGVGIESDVEKLTEDYNLVVANMVDVRGLAAVKYGDNRMKNGGLKSLAMAVIGKEVGKPKGVTMSRWDNQWLTPAQVKYACVDAYLSFEIGRVLISGDRN